MTSRSELEKLQADRLDEDDSSDMLPRLRSIQTRSCYQSWIESFDPHMTKLAAELVRKWGRRGHDR